MDKQSLEFFEKYLNLDSPSGYEGKSQKFWVEYLQPYIDEYYVDHYNNAVCIINPTSKFKVLLEAHADEISWIVNFIDEKGFLHVIPNGGADPEVCPGKEVIIHSSLGAQHGVFGWPPIHLRYDIRNLIADDDHLFIDCGCKSARDVKELGINVGDVVTFSNKLRIINNNYFVGKGLDNRIGALIIAEVARKIKETKTELPFGLYIVNAVQEEAGLNGAEMISSQIKPNIAIVTDVTHDTNIPFIDMRKHGDTRCGQGPVLAIAPVIHKGLLKMTKDIAIKNNIPFQLVAVSRETSTDADAIALAEGGISSILISPPLKYMHTPVEMVCIQDVKHTIQLMFELLKNIDPDHINLNNI